VHVENVDVGRPQASEAVFDAELHCLGVVAHVEVLLLDGVVARVSEACVLGDGWNEFINLI
jgi:hypothetical protein